MKDIHGVCKVLYTKHFRMTEKKPSNFSQVNETEKSEILVWHFLRRTLEIIRNRNWRETIGESKSNWVWSSMRHKNLKNQNQPLECEYSHSIDDLVVGHLAQHTNYGSRVLIKGSKSQFKCQFYALFVRSRIEINVQDMRSQSLGGIFPFIRVTIHTFYNMYIIYTYTIVCISQSPKKQLMA